MDIYSAQSHMKKLLSYVQDISESDRRVYSKSRYRLKEISNTCESVISMISDILKDEMFEDSDDEFAGLNNKDVSSIVKNIETDIRTLPGSKASINSINTIQDKKKAIMLYNEILKQVATCKLENSFASSCANSIWYWFDCRFIKSRRICPDFRYSIYQLPIWIRNIVLWYGKNICMGTENIAEENFRSWCENILEDSEPTRYPLPYEIYDVSNSGEDYVNLTSVVLWDMLLDGGYIALCNRQPSEMYLKEDLIYNYCGSIEPSVLDRYSNYKQNSDVLNICGLNR